MAKNRMVAMMAQRTLNGPCLLGLGKMKFTFNIILTTFTLRNAKLYFCANDVAEEKRENTEIYYYHFQHFHNKVGQRWGFARPQSRSEMTSHAS